jgi:HPt (histidine-containing phosphotransfer) domain-containing protein
MKFKDADPLDARVIQELKDLQRPGGGDMFRELVGIFLAEIPARITGIRDAIRRRDVEAMASEAHRLKGSSQQMGATALVQLCNRIEAVGRRTRLADHALLAETEHEAERVRLALQFEAGLPPREG